MKDSLATEILATLKTSKVCCGGGEHGENDGEAQVPLKSSLVEENSEIEVISLEVMPKEKITYMEAKKHY